MINPGKLVFDIGANTGGFSELCLKHGAERIIAVEPLARCLPKNTKPEITYIQAAAGRQAGISQINVCDQSCSLSTMALDTWKSGRHYTNTWSKSESCAVLTLDSLIAKFGVPNFISIDVEGFEHEVLLGLSQAVPYLIFEFHLEHASEMFKCLDRLVRIGMPHFHIVPNEIYFPIEPVWHDADFIKQETGKQTRFWWGNILCKSKEN